MFGQGALSTLLTDNKNVDAFDPHPSIKWYWIAAVPMVSCAKQWKDYIWLLMEYADGRCHRPVVSAEAFYATGDSTSPVYRSRT